MEYAMSWWYPVDDYETLMFLEQNRDIYELEYNILAGRVSFQTMGFEVEQYYRAISRLCNIKRCDFDGSGPLETSFGVYRTPAAGLRQFLKIVDESGGPWEWHAEYEPRAGEYRSVASRRRGCPTNGCGSHWHVRPDFDGIYSYLGLPRTRENELQIWATFWNTMIELVYALLPLQIWHYYPRCSVATWAIPVYKRYSPMNPVLRDYTSDSYMYHLKHVEYWILTFNGMHGGTKPITVEWRLPEVHPGMWATAMYIVMYTWREVVRRGLVSPKLKRLGDATTTREIRDKLIEMTDEIYRGRNYWDVLEQFGPVEYYEGRNIHPWRDSTRYRDMKHVFETMLWVAELNAGTPYYRVAKLFRARCSPAVNERGFWNLLAPKGEFYWPNCTEADELIEKGEAG